MFNRGVKEGKTSRMTRAFAASFVTAMLSLVPATGYAAMEFVEVDFGVCRDFQLYRPLTIYKEPSLFLSVLNRILIDPEQGMKELMKESPVLTSVSGVVKIKLGRPETFKNFNAISRIYELADPRLHVDADFPDGSATIHMIQMCKGGEIGFVLQQDLEDAQKMVMDGKFRLPPSTRGNPIPQLPRQ